MDAISPVGWLCILPPAITIVLAIVSRRVVVSLLCGIVAAIFILLPSPSAAREMAGDEFQWLSYVTHSMASLLTALSKEHLWASLIDADHLKVFAFTSILGMQVALIHRCGGMQGIVRWATPWARTRRGGQLLTWALGLVVFIDDYANTLLLGSTLRPLTDRLRISREKLAFLVDTTAAPVSGLALVSTWVATEISAMQTGYANAGVDVGSQTFGIFVQTIPSRFYVLYALAFVFLCGLMCRDFGPMLTAEQKAQSAPEKEDSAEELATRPRAANAIWPIVVTLAVVVGWLIITGQAASSIQELPALSDWQTWGQIIGQGDSYVALVYGASAGLAVILLLNLAQRNLGIGPVLRTMFEGFVHILPAMVILWLAWTLSGLTGDDNLRTGKFLAAKITEFQLSPAFMPTIVFVLASGIAFSTGTSWGTMAILMPLVIPLIYDMLTQQMGEAPAVDHFLITATIGSVLAGAIFGDHCSPISDTTILSSRSSHCDHIAHVRTQMPYALVIAAVSIVVGTLPAGFGISSWITLPVGIAVMVAILLAFGKKVTAV